MKNQFLSVIIFAVTLAFVSCSGNGNGNFATGTFEATEVIVSSEANGRLVSFDIDEGDSISSGIVLGVIDTTQLYLKKLQMEASLNSLENSKSDVYKQIAVIKKQIETAEKEGKRVRNLLADGAATEKQLDDIVAQVELLQSQLVAQQSALTKANNSIDGQAASVGAQLLQLDDMLSKSRIVSPIDGVVVGKYLEVGELATQGRPLLKVADMKNMYIRAYLTSLQLYNIKLGEEVKVFADFGGGEKREYAGRVTWISEQSEFTPKTILTDDERANLVYAVKISVRNDGFIKLGMYGEIKW